MHVRTGQWLESFRACSRTVEPHLRLPEGTSFRIFVSEFNFDCLLIDVLKEKVLKCANGNFLEAKIPVSPRQHLSGCFLGFLFLHQEQGMQKQGLCKSCLPISPHYSSPHRGLVVFSVPKCFKIPDKRCCRNARTLYMYREILFMPQLPI